MANIGSGISTTWANKLLDATNGVASLPSGTTRYLALFTNGSGLIDGVLTDAVEVSGNGYSRINLANKLGNATDRISENDAEIVGPTPTGNWGKITFVAVMDAATGGNIIYVGQDLDPRVVDQNKQIHDSSPDSENVYRLFGEIMSSINLDGKTLRTRQNASDGDEITYAEHYDNTVRIRDAIIARLKKSGHSPNKNLVVDSGGNIVTANFQNPGISEVVDDTTPQLGGDLDVNSKKIISKSNGNITLEPNGTGKIVLDGIDWPKTAGSENQILLFDDSGNLVVGNRTMNMSELTRYIRILFLMTSLSLQEDNNGVVLFGGSTAATSHPMGF